MNEPTREDWLEAADALRGGDVAPVEQLLVEIDCPLALVDVFAMALEDAAQCDAAIAAFDEQAYQQWERELAMLERVQPRSVADAEKLLKRRAELESQRPVLVNARHNAIVADFILGGLRAVFPELFGLPPARATIMQFPARIRAALDALGIDYERPWRPQAQFGPRTEQTRRRTVRAARWNRPAPRRPAPPADPRREYSGPAVVHEMKKRASGGEAPASDETAILKRGSETE